MGCGTLEEVRDRSWDPQGDPGQVGGPSGRTGMGQWTLGEVWDGSRALKEVLEWL